MEVEGGWEVIRWLGGYLSIGLRGPKGTRPIPCHPMPSGLPRSTIGLPHSYHEATMKLPQTYPGLTLLGATSELP